jgi:hypothetical protein
LRLLHRFVIPCACIRMIRIVVASARAPGAAAGAVDMVLTGTRPYYCQTNQTNRVVITTVEKMMASALRACSRRVGMRASWLS